VHQLGQLPQPFGLLFEKAGALFDRTWRYGGDGCDVSRLD